MSQAQKRSYDTLFPVYGTAGNVNPWDNDHNTCPLIIEIGFGMGTATAVIAEKNPGIKYLGIEVHKPGIGRLLWEIEKRELKNVRIVEGDAAQFLKHGVKDGSVSAFHVFFPDPWPKKRHHKRRLITRPFTDLLAAKLIPGGYVYMVSDWNDYSEWALKELTETPGIINKYNYYADTQDWRPRTEFEKKGLRNNHEIRELFFLRNKE